MTRRKLARVPDTIVLMNECANVGCRRRPVLFERLSDFFVGRCSVCKDGKITLDIERINFVAENFQVEVTPRRAA